MKTDIKNEPEDGYPCSICHKPILIDKHPIASQIVRSKEDSAEIFAHLYCTFEELGEIDKLEIMGADNNPIEITKPYPFGYPEPNFYRGF